MTKYNQTDINRAKELIDEDHPIAKDVQSKAKRPLSRITFIKRIAEYIHYERRS